MFPLPARVNAHDLERKTSRWYILNNEIIVSSSPTHTETRLYENLFHIFPLCSIRLQPIKYARIGI